MTLNDRIMNKIPNYYPTMNMDGFSPEQILMAKRRQMHQEIQEKNNPEPPTNIHITGEIKKK